LIELIVWESHRVVNFRESGRDNGAAHVLLEGHNQ